VARRVVIVEDQTVLRELLVEVLSSDSRYEVVGAFESAAALLRALRSTAPDVVIVDYALPGMNGLELAKRVMAGGAKAVLLTAHDHPDLLRDAVACAIHGVVSKSGPLRTVKEAVESVLEGKPYRCHRTEAALREVETSNPESLSLTAREQEIVRLVASGLTSKQIGQRLGLSNKTVVNHRTNAMRKLGIHDVVTLTRYALARGLLSNP